MMTVHVFEPPDNDRKDRNMKWRGEIKTNIDIFDTVLFAELDCRVGGYNIPISNIQQEANNKDKQWPTYQVDSVSPHPKKFKKGIKLLS
jgi:hypothetical protein